MSFNKQNLSPLSAKEWCFPPEALSTAPFFSASKAASTVPCAMINSRCISLEDWGKQIFLCSELLNS